MENERYPRVTQSAAHFLSNIYAVKIPEDRDLASEQLDAIFYEALGMADERGQPHTLGNVVFHAIWLVFRAGWMMRGKAAAQEE